MEPWPVVVGYGSQGSAYMYVNSNLPYVSRFHTLNGCAAVDVVVGP